MAKSELVINYEGASLDIETRAKRGEFRHAPLPSGFAVNAVEGPKNTPGTGIPSRDDYLPLPSFYGAEPEENEEEKAPEEEPQPTANELFPLNSYGMYEPEAEPTANAEGAWELPTYPMI